MFRYRLRRRRKRRSSVTKHYRLHKETARRQIHERLTYWNQFYGYQYNRVAIRNQKTCWGSCTAKRNLNFSYKLIFLPESLMDYIIVHELCHLGELNHGKQFWALVERALPDYKSRVQTLRVIERGGTTPEYLMRVKEGYQSVVSRDITHSL